MFWKYFKNKKHETSRISSSLYNICLLYILIFLIYLSNNSFDDFILKHVCNIEYLIQSQKCLCLFSRLPLSWGFSNPTCSTVNFLKMFKQRKISLLWNDFIVPSRVILCFEMWFWHLVLNWNMISQVSITKLLKQLDAPGTYVDGVNDSS